jgi:prolyl oligopeptidase
VKPGVGYPGILLTGVEHDAAVNAFHARKMAAALQAATASNPADRPVLLRVDRDAIQTADALLSRQFHDAVDQRLFLLWQLGML